MKRKTKKSGMNSRKAWCVGVLSVILALSGLFGCGKTEEYTVAVAQGGISDQTGTGSEESTGTQAQEAGADLEEAAGTEQAGETEQAAAAKDAVIYVDIGGAVCNPGVYALAADARVYEGIEAAGGLLPEAYTKALNQAQLLSDGEKVYVPTAEEWKSAGQENAAIESAFQTQEQDDGMININTADAGKLCELPGVGESRAQAIIAYREENGPFTDIAQIQNVSGIKSGLFSKIRDLIKVQ